MNAHPPHLTGARLTTFLRRGYALDDGRARPFPYPEPKFVRMAETVTYLPEEIARTAPCGAAKFSRSVAPVNIARVKWAERE